MGDVSVFESKPVESKAHASAEKTSIPENEGPSVCESTPAESIAHTSSSVCVVDTWEGPSVCESMPTESTAHVKAVDQVATDADANATSVFENMPRKSQATITHSDTLQGLSEGPSVFESQPPDRITDYAHNVERGESESEWTTDSEEESVAK